MPAIEQSYVVKIREDEAGRVEVTAFDQWGAPFAGHADSTGTLSVADLLRPLLHGMYHDWLEHVGPGGLRDVSRESA